MNWKNPNTIFLNQCSCYVNIKNRLKKNNNLCIMYDFQNTFIMYGMRGNCNIQVQITWSQLRYYLLWHRVHHDFVFGFSI